MLLKVFYDRAMSNASDPSLTLASATRRMETRLATAHSHICCYELMEWKLLRQLERGVRTRYEITALGIDKLNKFEQSQPLSPAIDSSAWTGLPDGFSLTEHQRCAIVAALDAANDSLTESRASQHNQAQARAYIIAARSLLEAPDPEAKLAWELIGRANSLAGIATLLVTIITLFLAK